MRAPVRNLELWDSGDHAAERWKVIPQFPAYDVSNFGMVYSWKSGKYLKPFQDTKGYARIELHGEGYKKKFKLHKLVALLFVPNPEGKPQVGHLDANRMNARADNLMWVTQIENEYHKTIDFKSKNGFI